MATNKVTMTLPPRELKRADAEFKVSRDGKRYGTLKISNGSVVWFPPHTSYGLKLHWPKFDRLFREHATREEKR